MTEEPDLYDRMKAMGVKMSWYERVAARKRHTNVIPLDDQICSSGSIYFLKEDGSLWTLDSSHEPYHSVRPPLEKPLKRSVYICVKCKRQWGSMPKFHEEITT